MGRLHNWSGKKVIGHDGDAPALFDSLFDSTFAKLGRLTIPQTPAADAAFKPDPADYVGDYTNIAGTLSISHNKGQHHLALTRPPGQVAGIDLPATPVVFIDRNTVRMASGDPRLDNQPITLQGNDRARPDFVGYGLRLYRRSRS